MSYIEKVLQPGETVRYRGKLSGVGEAFGWRLGRLVDPSGLHWEISRPPGN